MDTKNIYIYLEGLVLPKTVKGQKSSEEDLWNVRKTMIEQKIQMFSMFPAHAKNGLTWPEKG